MTRHVVAAPLVLIHQGGGDLGYFYAGTVLPEDADAAEVERHVAKGMVRREGPAPVAGEQDPPPADDPPADPPLERPKRTASREAWAAYRAAQGHEVGELGKQQLIDLGD